MKPALENWKTQTLALSDLDLDMQEIFLNLGYGGAVPEPHFIEMLQHMLQEIAGFCKPETGYCIKKIHMPDEKFLIADQQPVKVGQVITKYLRGCSHIAAFVVTAGPEFDEYCKRLNAEGDIVSAFIAYSIGTEIAEAAVRFVSESIAGDAESLHMGCTQTYSPGYCSWHVREQENLFRILPEKPCGIVLNESSLMYPEKSVSGIIGLGENVRKTAHSCEICGMVTCFKRKKQL